MCNENHFVHMYYSAFTIVAHTNVYFGYGGGGSKIISETWPVRGPADLNWGRDQKVERCQFQQDRDRQRRETSGRSEGLLEIHGLVLPYEVYIVFLLFWDCEIFFGFFHESRLNCKSWLEIFSSFWMTETQICSNRQKHTFYLILFVETCWETSRREMTEAIWPLRSYQLLRVVTKWQMAALYQQISEIVQWWCSVGFQDAMSLCRLRLGW